MNKKMVLWIALIAMAIIPVYAQQYNSENDFQIDWDRNVKDGVVITKYTGTRREVSIPPSIQNNPVTGIRSKAFESFNITSVIIPDSVTAIGEEAFKNCRNLTSVTIGNGVTSIGSSAFYSCISLKSVTIPDSVTSIGNYAFANCTSLTSVTIPAKVTGIGTSTFERCTSLTSVTIPEFVFTIGQQAFSDCAITSVTIPANVSSIEYRAFGITSLTSVTFEGRVEKFGDGAFPGGLQDTYRARDGGPGTYKRFAGGSTWKKQ